MKKIVPIYIIIFTFFGLNYSFGQIKLDSTTIAQISIHHQYHCNFSKKQFKTEFDLGERLFHISHLEYIEKKDELILIGQIAESNYGLPCNIEIATISETKCKSEYFIGTTDNNGNFNIKIKKDQSKSIYFTSIGYCDLEVKIKSIYSR